MCNACDPNFYFIPIEGNLSFCKGHVVVAVSKISSSVGIGITSMVINNDDGYSTFYIYGTFVSFSIGR